MKSEHPHRTRDDRDGLVPVNSVVAGTTRYGTANYGGRCCVGHHSARVLLLSNTVQGTWLPRRQRRRGRIRRICIDFAVFTIVVIAIIIIQFAGCAGVLVEEAMAEFH